MSCRDPAIIFADGFEMKTLRDITKKIAAWEGWKTAHRRTAFVEVTIKRNLSHFYDRSSRIYLTVMQPLSDPICIRAKTAVKHRKESAEWIEKLEWLESDQPITHLLHRWTDYLRGSGKTWCSSIINRKLFFEWIQQPLIIVLIFEQPRLIEAIHREVFDGRGGFRSDCLLVCLLTARWSSVGNWLMDPVDPARRGNQTARIRVRRWSSS